MDYSSDANIKRRKARRSKRKKAKNKASAIIFRIGVALALIAGFAAAGAAVGAYVGIIEGAPELTLVQMGPDAYTSFVYDDTGKEIDRYSGIQNRVYASMKDIPVHLANAFVAIEDRRFYSHDGVDYRGLVRAVYQTLIDRTQGASTITQQVIKNMLKIKRNDVVTKLQEQYLAVQFEKKLVEDYGSKEAAKEYILEVYLNVAFLGHSAYGVQAAANFYFGKDVSELTLSECTAIAAVTQNPTKYSPKSHPEENRKRRQTALDDMLELGMITPAEYDEAVADTAVYERVNQVSQLAAAESAYHSYFGDAVFSSVSEALQEKFTMTPEEANNYIHTGGLQIYTTQNMRMQEIVDEMYTREDLFPSGDFEIDISYTLAGKNTVTGEVTDYPEERMTVRSADEIEPFIQSVKEKYLKANDIVLAERRIATPQPQSGMAVIDHHTGEVKAISGGRGEKEGDLWFNRATQATRQPGSVFKVLASYLPGIDMGLITPATVYDDVPFTVGGYSPNNWYSGYKGLSTVRMGIVGSMNILATKNIVNNGLEESFNYLENLGFTTLVEGETRSNGKFYTDKTVTSALGGITDGVTQVELAAAFAAIANGGEYNKPIFFTKVLDHAGVTILENPIESRTVIKPTTAYLLTDMMREVLTGTAGIAGTGGRANFTEVRMPVAGKTGTTTDNIDYMFTGFTPYYTASVYLGFDQPKSLLHNSNYHITLWRAIMEEIHRDLPYRDFERPSGIVECQVCRSSGKLAKEGFCDHDPRGSMVYTEKFAAGTEPTEECDVHVKITIDSVTQQLAGPYCPADVLEELVILKRPEPYTGEAVIDDQLYEYKRYTEGGECSFHAHGYQPPAQQPGVYNPGGYSDFYYQAGTPAPEVSAQPIPTPGPNTADGSFIMTPMPPIMPSHPTPAPVNPQQPGTVPTWSSPPVMP